MEEGKKSKSKGDKKTKKSGVRTKFLIESLRNDYYALREENDRLRGLVTNNLPEEASKEILAECFDPNAPKATKDNIDDLASQLAGADVDDDDEDD
jgi:hypothetical protein